MALLKHKGLSLREQGFCPRGIRLGLQRGGSPSALLLPSGVSDSSPPTLDLLWRFVTCFLKPQSHLFSKLGFGISPGSRVWELAFQNESDVHARLEEHPL